MIRPTAARFARMQILKEPHPFFIWPSAAKPAPVSWKFYANRLRSTASMYVPIYVIFFGWTWVAKEAITSAGVLNHEPYEKKQ